MCSYPAGGGVKLRKDVHEGRGVKGKAEKCGQGGEGVKKFADVLYVWSLMASMIFEKSCSLCKLQGGRCFTTNNKNGFFRVPRTVLRLCEPINTD